MDARGRNIQRKGFTLVSGWEIRHREQAGTEFGLAAQQQVAFNRCSRCPQGCSWMAGVIDDAAVFDTVLSLKEIQTIFKSPNGLKGAILAGGSPQSKLAVTWGQLKSQ